ncbi:lysM and putative peptidoglycan-binding domain-containing protein 2 isoform X1 [Harpegnathos saltator]|uniref:LysM and putative peptidoglycan-binding domain-containing protein 2 n=1 Tax=Harpegnathos saltator TaxID=610380 RepID=E2BKP7_HARSA|nr:lysM and putative peptidoglycan-binding domain-containing protein 2 isoform X1 [Harpegnathos saltator]XP_011140673.1 lysM and putative peptidoglycan-binding domain-containing protein 2 isoform X1 [Harpegnathos saltator]XP_019697363.1 lysM and putative peptidoglycan-binding domain-containing protein 2 isoform X1 [Harpegnathos saltator]XP_019697364.1 lysM and putative peptidoglycan-binding domain-containing protein 2 isoform X1 [Harpegnathos saltator]EFN83745.1 LysM and putative peptidoglycan-
MERNGAREMEERRCIRDTGRTLKKYGSTAKHMTRTESLVKHIISASDTLQGIALKYGVTTEQIRRVNRLWASDSLFLREHLLIPVNADSPASVYNDEPVVPSEEHDVPPNISSPSSISSSIDDESSVNDFLAKMDTSIANVKKEVKRAQGNSEFCTNSNDVYVQRRRASAKLRNSHSTTSNSPSDSSRPASSSDMHNFPTAVVMTQGRRVKTSLQRLEQQQDEMFQL